MHTQVSIGTCRCCCCRALLTWPDLATLARSAERCAAKACAACRLGGAGLWLKGLVPCTLLPTAGCCSGFSAAGAMPNGERKSYSATYTQ
jgi:hypothetical protein